MSELHITIILLCSYVCMCVCICIFAWCWLYFSTQLLLQPIIYCHHASIVCSPCCCYCSWLISSDMLFICRISSSIVLNNCHMLFGQQFLTLFRLFACNALIYPLHTVGSCFARLKINPATDCHWPSGPFVRVVFLFEVRSFFLLLLLFRSVACWHPHIWQSPFSISDGAFHEILCAFFIKRKCLL